MKVNEDSLKALFQRREGRLENGRAGCPEAEVLARAGEGLLEGEARDTVADHLISCPDCAEEYRLLGPLGEWAKQAAQGVPAKVVVMKPAASRAWRIPHTLAASLAVVSVGLGAFSLSLRQESRRLQELAAQEHSRLEAATRQAGAFESRLAELQRDLEQLSQPTPNVPIVDLVPHGAERGAETSAATVVAIPANVGLVTLILNLGSEPSYPAYAADLLGQQGQPIWHGEGLTKSAESNFTLALPARLVPPGQYRLRLQGKRRDGTKVLLQDYALKVVSPPR